MDIAELKAKNNKLLVSKFAIDASADFKKQKHPSYQYGFITITKNKNKWWRCTEKVVKNGQILHCICAISNSKYQTLTQEEKQNLKVHDHVYPSFKTILSNYSNHKQHNDDTTMMLTKAFCIFAAKANLSMSLITSRPMKDLISTAIEWGRKFPDISPEEIFENRNSFTKQFLYFADDLQTRMLHFLESYEYISIQIDAGKVGSKNYLETTISNFYSKTSPAHYSTEEFFAGTADSYTECITRIIEELTNEQHFTISAIVGDNLRVQWASLRNVQHNYKNSSTTRSFLILPCSCHNISLALNDAFSANSVLHEAQTSIIYFSSVFRKKRVTALFQKTCPEYCETRWNCLFDIAAWIVSHFLQLDAFLHDPVIKLIPQISDISSIVKTIYIEAPLIVILLSSFKTLSKLFEGDSLPMSDVFPLTISAINKGRRIAGFCEVTASIFKSIETAVTQRIFHNENSLILYLIFNLTLMGRKFESEVIRGKESWDPIDCEEFCSKNFEINVDEILVSQAKIMLDSRSVFHKKFQKLNELHVSDLFTFQENDEEKKIRQEKERHLQFLKSSENINGWAKQNIISLENELQRPMRFLNIKSLQNIENDEEAVANLEEPLVNDFIPVSGELPDSEIRNQDPEVQQLFFDEKLFAAPQTYNPNFWKKANKSILFTNEENHVDFMEEEEESSTTWSNEKLKSYFNDFELEEDVLNPDITFHEDQIFRTISEVCSIYKLNEQFVLKAFLEEWRNSSWDDSFALYFQAYHSNPFDFWKHLKDFGTKEEKELAGLGLRLVTILASEASVERVFSEKRPISTGKFNKSSTTLTNARLTIRWYANQKDTLPDTF